MDTNSQRRGVVETLSADLAPGSSPRSMRAQNEQLVVRAIRRQRTMTRTDLTNATGLAKSTIKDIVDVTQRGVKL